jgi:hypothetical protein
MAIISELQWMKLVSRAYVSELQWMKLESIFVCQWL